MIVTAWFRIPRAVELLAIPGFNDTIAGSFHIVMFPRKIFARTSPVKFNPLPIPGRLYAGMTALIDSGTVTTVAGRAEY